MSKVKARGSDDWNPASEEEEEGRDGKGGHYGHNFNLSNSRKNLDTERDSGIPSTDRTASIYGDLDMSDSEERGVYDYFPPQETKKKNESIKISHTDNPDYDEAIDVESDKSSVDSPRSDASSTNEYNVTNPPEEEGIEMKSFRTNIHRTMYGTRSEFPYVQLKTDSDDEEYCQTPIQQQRKFIGNFPKRSVDDTVQFSLSNTYSQSLEEAESGGFGKPPFGCRNQLNNVGSSIERLLSPAHVMGTYFQDEMKKKKPLKKKKGSKDDTDERLNSSRIKKTPMQHDENGNPIDFRAHRQMRELSVKSTEGSVFSSKKHSNSGFSSDHGNFRETSNFDTNSFQGQTVKDGEEGASSTDRKKNRRKPPPMKLAEDIPNYVGNLPNVDDLVKFINTQNIDEKQLKKKINQKTSPALESAPKADKLTKKNKEKKGKVGVPEDNCDNPSVPPAEPSVSNTNIKTAPSQAPAQKDKTVQPAESDSKQPVQTVSAQADAEIDSSVQLVEVNSTHCKEEDMGNSGDKAAASSLVESQILPEEPIERSKDKKVDTKMGPCKDTSGHPENVSSSKSPPLQKKEIECKDKNIRNKTKEKEKLVEPVAPAVDNSKKQKAKPGKTEGQLKNNKKMEVKNDVLPDTRSVDMVKSESVPDTLAVTKLESDLEINENQHYIFTDIDNLPPVEQEFTLVSKKKKRQGAKEVFPEFPRPKNGPREYRGVPPARSVTPPPSSVSKKEQTRDLSPSSFPALGKKATVSKVGPKFREGRRNSLGDVPIDTLTELRSQDDSDIESVKSLPAAKGGSLSDIVSSRFPVSYAKMAAAPKPPLSPNSPRSDEDDHVLVDSASSRKPTVWKGSPTERRHSIGSSPEDTKQENSPKLSQRSRQKSGSQEFLLSDSVKGDVDVAGVVMEVQSSSVNVKLVSSSDDNLTVSEETLPGASPKSHIVSPEDKPSNNSPSVPTITLTLDSSREASDIVLSHPNGPKKVPLNGPLNGPSNGPQTILKTEMFNHTDMSRSQPSVSSVSKDSRSKPVSVRVNNTYNKKNNKSVIFLDKRFSDAPEKLDITFGFDSNFDHQDEGSRHSAPIVCATVENPQDSVSIVNKATGDQNQSEAQPALTLPKEKASKSELSSASSTAPNTSTAPSSIPNSSMGTAVLPGSVALPVTSKTIKAQVGGLNGVVLPKTQGSRNSLGADVVRTDRAAEVNSAAASKDKAKTVLFFYGEGIVVKSDNMSIDSRDNHPGASQHKGQLAFSPDATASEGKFNVNEAIKYLKQEWDRVLEQKDKNPQAVQFYNGQ